MKAANYQASAANWQIELINCITDPKVLLAQLKLKPSDIPIAVTDFPLRVPRSYVARMQPGNPHDPLLLQILPQSIELNAMPGYSNDPLAENQGHAVPGLLHKYKDRALLIVTGACAIHCRYCFRRHFPYQDHLQGRSALEEVLIYLQQRPEIKEIILSGGDPLTMKDQLLLELIEKLATIPHLQRLRIHTRLPIVLPERITPELMELFSATRLKPVIVVHANHANEIDDQVKAAIGLMRQAQLTVLNQSVLLKGINNSVTALVDLSEALFGAGILPYYLHLLDPVAGAAHFAVTDDEAKQLVSQMRAELPGYLVPKLVREVPGAASKIPIL